MVGLRMYDFNWC